MSRNAESRFSMLPGVDIERSKFDRHSQHKTTFDAGRLIPIFIDECLPGDTFSMDMATLVRMSTPIFPTMDNAFLDVYFFYIPSRLVWSHWREFNGENRSGYWTQSVEYQIPQLKTVDDGDSVGFDVGSLGDYFGIPTGVEDLSVSALPFRCYVLCWNEFFRDQNCMQPAYFTVGDDDVESKSCIYVNNMSGNDFDNTLINAIYGAKPLPVSRYHDYFSSVLPQPQKGEPVSLPLYQDNIPVFTGSERDSQDFTGYPALKFTTTTDNTPQDILVGLSGGQGRTYDAVTAGADNLANQVSTVGLYPNNLYADVSQVAVATISQLRQAFQLQRLLERDARGGTRYRELIKSHFSVDSPDSRMQVPEYLGGKRIPINIDQVLQTSSTDSVSPQGNTAAYSLTSDIDSSFTKSFTEHGYILGLCCVRTEHTYQQGIERFWSRKNRFDFYWPALAHISEQAVLVKEIYATGSEHDDDAFGYQEPWADYRYKPSRISGYFRSNAPGTLDSWHYADYYTGNNDNFVFNADWLQETPFNIDRTLAVPSGTSHQFIADFYFKLECVRPMPLYSVPGLVDHY